MSLITFNTVGPAGNGLNPGALDCTITNKSAGTFALGDVVMFDRAAAGSGVTSVDPGGTGTSIYNCCIAPTSGQGGWGYFGVVVGGTAVVGSETVVRVFGLVEFAFIIYSAGSSAIGDPLIPVAAKNLDGVTATANAKVCGIARQVVTTPTTRTLAKVDFNGVNGFGTRA